MALNELLPLGELKDMTYISVLIFLAATSLIQISPIKINPWTAIFKWLGEQLTGELRKDLNGLITDVRRQTILTFARECRQSVDHSAEEWDHVLNVAEEYEAYCEAHKIKNGRIKQDTKYIRDLYQEMSREHRIN
jgi:hypothetical protein